MSNNRVSSFVMVYIAIVFLLFAWDQLHKPTTTWIDFKWTNEYAHTTVQLGQRSDGVVVWRSIPYEEPAPYKLETWK